jgi:hypothetical protein
MQLLNKEKKSSTRCGNGFTVAQYSRMVLMQYMHSLDGDAVPEGGG